MHNDLQHENTNLIVPFKVVTGIIMSLVLVFMVYIFGNYVVAAPLQKSPEITASTQTSEVQSPWQTLDSHAHLIVYRDDSSAFMPDTVLNVFINDQYHTSVLPHTRAVELLLCPGNKDVKVALSQHDHHRFSQLSKIDGMSPTLQAGERYYFQVALNMQGKIAARWVSEKEAKTALSGLKMQKRTLSRVLNEDYCPEATYTINSADVFTHHDSSSALSAQGNRALMALVKTIHREFEKIDKVVVNNYSDVYEDKTSVHPLSQLRANSVTTWLVNSSFPSPLILAQETDLHCSKSSLAKYANQACLNFNRSMGIEVYGIRKNARSPH